MEAQEPLYDDRSQLRDLARLVLKARKSLRWAVPLSLLIAVLAGFYSQSRAGSYTSEAVAIIRPQTSPERITSTAESEGAQDSGSSGPNPLDVTDYRLLLTSDMILEEVVRSYNNQFGASLGPLKLGMVRKMLYAEERLKLKSPYNVEYYPTLQMQATASSPDQSYMLLNTWIEMAEKWAHDVTFQAKENVYEYVDVEFDKARTELVTLEELLNSVTAESEDLKDQLVMTNLSAEEEHLLETIRLKRDLSDEWDDKIAEAKQAYQLESISQKRALAEEWDQKIVLARSEYNLPFHEANVESLIAQSLKVEAELADAELRLIEAQARMAELQKQVTLHPEMIVTAKAITDDALWENRAPDKRLESLKLRTEEINPVMVAIKNDIRATEVDLAAIPATTERLKTDLSGIQTETLEDQGYVYGRRLDLELQERAKASALEALDIERNLGLALLEEKILREKEGAIRGLEATRENGLTIVKRLGETAVGKLDRDRKVIEQRVQRDLDTQSGIFDSLTRSRLRAKMAVANTIEEFDVLSKPTLQNAKQGSLVGGTIVGGVIFCAAVCLLFGMSLFRVFFSELTATAEHELEKPRA